MITTGKISHKGQERFKVSFPYDIVLINKVKQIEGARWSQSLKSWHIPYTKKSLEAFRELFKAYDIKENRFADKRKSNSPKSESISKVPQAYLDNHTKALVKWLKHKRYSDSTITTYTESVKIFLSYHYPRQAEELSSEDMVKFVNEYILKNNFSYSYQNQVISGVKIFYREILKTDLDVERFERPRRQHKIPNVLSKGEIKSLIDVTKNTKHKTLLIMVYSCGLRRSEVMNLRLSDVDSKRKLIIIRNSKGKKDRIVPISDKIINLLREYYKAYKPKTWLFEGQEKGVQYSVTSMAKVLKKSCRSAGISKPVSLHWLRHSYATHLMESGTDIRIIQELLGHKSSKTTEIYTHVSTKTIQNIKSPFDEL
jgi:integrase/recombinase XerD